MSLACGRWLLVKWKNGSSGVVNVRSCVDDDRLLKIGDEVTITKRGGSARIATLIAASDDRKSLQKCASQAPGNKNLDDELVVVDDIADPFMSTSGSSWTSEVQNLSDSDDEVPLKKRFKRDYARRQSVTKRYRASYKPKSYSNPVDLREDQNSNVNNDKTKIDLTVNNITDTTHNNEDIDANDEFSATNNNVVTHNVDEINTKEGNSNINDCVANVIKEVIQDFSEVTNDDAEGSIHSTQSNSSESNTGNVTSKQSIGLNRKSISFIKQEIKELGVIGFDFKKDIEDFHASMKRTLSIKHMDGLSNISRCSVSSSILEDVPINYINKTISPMDITSEQLNTSDVLCNKVISKRVSKAIATNSDTSSKSGKKIVELSITKAILDPRKKKLKKIRSPQTTHNSSSEESEMPKITESVTRETNNVTKSPEMTLEHALGIENATSTNILNVIHGLYERFKDVSKTSELTDELLAGHGKRVYGSHKAATPIPPADINTPGSSIKLSSSRSSTPNGAPNKIRKSRPKSHISKVSSCIPNMPGLLYGTFEYKLNPNTGIVERTPKYSIIYEGKKFDIPNLKSFSPEVKKTTADCKVSDTTMINAATPNITSKMSVEEQLSLPSSSDDESNSMVEIGSGETSVPWHVIKNIDWDNYELATRKLLTGVFPRRILATHTLLGNKENKPPPYLDQTKIDDIISTVVTHCDVTKKQVRSAIIKKCLDENNLMRNLYCTSKKMKNSRKIATPNFKVLQNQANVTHNISHSRRSSGEVSMKSNNSLTSRIE